MTKAVVTGGAGFIGSHLVDGLLAEGMDVVVFDDLSTGRRENVPSGVRLVEANLADVASPVEEFRDADYVFHLAALPRIQPSFDDPVLHEEVNVVGTLRLMQALRGNPVLKKVVVSSSSACYGTPTELPTPETAAISCLSPYALQKYAAEQNALILGERHSIPVVSLRYFNVYGPRSYDPRSAQSAYSSVIGIFRAQKREGRPLTITGDGEQRRDFVHVHDVVRANLAAARGPTAGVVYNVGSGTSFSVNDVAALFDHPVVHVPERLGEARVTWADVRKIRGELGWRPTIDLKAGMGMLE